MCTIWYKCTALGGTKKNKDNILLEKQSLGPFIILHDIDLTTSQHNFKVHLMNLAIYHCTSYDLHLNIILSSMKYNSSRQIVIWFLFSTYILMREKNKTNKNLIIIRNFTI